MMIKMIRMLAGIATMGWLAVVFPLLGVAAMSVERNELDNGMRVIYDVDTTAPLVATMVAIRSGSALETDQTHGLTHLLEHMLFDGTTSSSRIELSDRISRSGGYINAFTRKDHILFMTVMPAENARIGVQTLAEMLFESTLPEEELEKERKVVLEELARDAQHAYMAASDIIDRNLLHGTAYSKSIAGRPEVIEAADRETLESFYGRMFIPGNMTFIAVGDFQPARMDEWVSASFGAREASEPPPAIVTAEPRWNRRIVRRLDDLDMDHLAILLPLLPKSHPHSAALSLGLAWFAEGEDSILRNALAEAGAPVMMSSCQELRHPGMAAAIIHIMVTPGAANQAESVFLDTFDKLAQRRPTEDEIDRLQATFRSDLLLDNEKFDHRGWGYAAEDLNEGIEIDQQWTARLLEADAETVTQALERHLAGTAPSRCLVIKKQERERSPSEAAPMVRRVFGNGLTVLVQRNPIRPIAAAVVLVKDRSLLEPDGGAGITQLTLDLLPEGAGTMDKSAINRKLNALGARLDTADNPFIPFDDYLLSPYYAFLHLQLPSDNFTSAFNLLGVLLSDPTFPEDSIESAKNGLRQRIGINSRKPVERLDQLIMQSLFSDSPLTHGLFGSHASLANIDRQRIIDHAKKILAPSNLILSVYGDVQEDDLWTAIERSWATWPDQGDGAGTDYPEATRLDTEKPLTAAMAGANAAVGYVRWINNDPQDLTALNVLTEALQERMVQRIRETEGLAYSLGAGIERLPAGTLVRLVVPTRAENVDRVAELLEEIVRALPEAVPAKEALDHLKARMLGRHHRYRQRRVIAAHFAATEEYWWPGIDRAPFAERLDQVRVEDLNRLSEQLWPAEKWSKIMIVPDAEDGSATE